MKGNLRRDLTVGAVVLIAAIIFTIGVFSIGSEQRVWVRKVSYKLRIPGANGLQSGSPVRLAGVQVGTVTSLDFSEDPNVIAIEVVLSVDVSYQHRIRSDTEATLRILTLLGGERYVELTPGTASNPVVPPGSYIHVPPSFGMEELGELSAGLSEDLKSISGNVRIILETVQRQEGVVGRMLLDPNFGSQVFEDIGESASMMRGTIESVHSGRGLAGRLLSDDQFARETTASIRDSLDRLERLMGKLTEEEGVVYQVLDPNGKVAGSLESLNRASGDLQAFAADLRGGGGTLGRLVSDEAYAEEVLGNIKQISKDLADITGKLNAGEGSLGGLINDPSLHQDLKDVVRGVQESKTISWLIRHYRKKGEKERLEKEKQLRERPGLEDGSEDGETSGP